MRKPCVLLLGDSISLGYRDSIKRQLIDECRVLYPVEQGKMASDIYRMMYEWDRDVVKDSEVDFVYWNAGLWDVVKTFGDEVQTDIDSYKHYIKLIADRIRKLYPRAISCFALTTHVLEERYGSDLVRSNSDIDEYNKAAIEVLIELVDNTDDLNTLIAGHESYKDPTHFCISQDETFAKHISGLIRKELSHEIHLFTKGKEQDREELQDLLERLSAKEIRPKVLCWGVTDVFNTYYPIISEYSSVIRLADRDKQLQGLAIRTVICEEIPTDFRDIDLVIVTARNRSAQKDIEEFCINNGILSCTYLEYMDVMWSKYEEDILLRERTEFEDYNPKLEPRMTKYIGINITENLCNLDCEYCYLSVFQDRRYENIRRKNPHNIKYIRRQLSQNVLGGSCLIGITGSGETMLADKHNEMCMELLKEGHYLHVVTNGTTTEKIKDLITQSGPYAKNIIFKLSFHYLELKKNNLLEKFTKTVNLIADSDASYTIELMPYDELAPYIDEIKEYSMEKFGAYPHLTMGRDENNSLKLLSNMSYKEFCDTWSVFDSTLFDVKKKLYMKKGMKCKAGEKGLFFDLYSGNLQRCVYQESIGNLYIDGIENIDMNSVGDACPLNYCFNSHIYAPIGMFETDGMPSYMMVRDRIRTDGEHWIKPDMRRYLDCKL